MTITLSGEYDRGLYYINRLSWLSILLMLLVIAGAAVKNDSFLGVAAYISLSVNICFICYNRQYFLENEMFRIGRLIVNENGGFV